MLWRWEILERYARSALRFKKSTEKAGLDVSDESPPGIDSKHK